MPNHVCCSYTHVHAVKERNIILLVKQSRTYVYVCLAGSVEILKLLMLLPNIYRLWIAALQKTNIIRDFLEDIEEEPAPRSESGSSEALLQTRNCMCLPVGAQHTVRCASISKAAADLITCHCTWSLV